MTLIGIDPAFRKTGFAVVVIDENREAQGYMFRSFLDFIEWVPLQDFDRPVYVGIENSNMQDLTFNPKASPKQHRNVGANQAASQYTVDYCRHYFGNEYVFEISPKQKGRKWTAGEFKAIAKQDGHAIIGRFNQDQRDAYQIATHMKKLASFKAAKIRI